MQVTRPDELVERLDAAAQAEGKTLEQWLGIQSMLAPTGNDRNCSGQLSFIALPSHSGSEVRSVAQKRFIGGSQSTDGPAAMRSLPDSKCWLHDTICAPGARRMVGVREVTQ